MKFKQLASMILIIICFLSGCSKAESEPLTKTDFLFDTVTTITIYDSAKPEILEQCFELCRTFEDKFSRTIETSEISQINNAGGIPVKVSPETYDVIEKGLYYSKLSKGKFDITIAPLSELWDFKNNPGVVPDTESIEAAKSHVNYENVLLDPAASTVCLTDPLAGIDLGGIAKGFIADRLKEYLKESGVNHALINLGGNVLAIGGKSKDRPYNIGIQKPFAAKNETVCVVKAFDQSIVTSGIYERYFEQNGKLYHHILDPQSGYPYESNLSGVTIRSDSSADGDALSTICLALGLDEAMSLINSMDSVSALFITEDNELHYSDHF